MIAIVIVNLKKRDILVKKYFIKGLTVKLIGGLAFALAYTYYYEYGGDTKAYFRHVQLIFDYFFYDPALAFEYVFNSNISLGEHNFVRAKEIFHKGSPEFFSVAIMSIVNVFALNNYFSLTILFSFLSYLGIWKLFYLIANKYPHLVGKIAFAVLFIPSVFFWGSGVMKDTIVIGFIGLLLSSFYQIVENKKIFAFSTLTVFISAWVIFEVKQYVVLSLIPALMIWWVFNIRNSFKSKFLQTVILPISIVLLSIGLFFALQIFSQTDSKYSIERVIETAQGMQSWHQVQEHRIDGTLGRGSSYSLGEYDESILGILIMMPASINVTLFRPYPTEVRSVVMAISSIESTLILIASIYIFIGLGFFRIIKILNNDAFLLMALIFSLFFAFAVGFTSYNFGALARYKIPCIPFYLCALFILQDKARVMKKNKYAYKKIKTESKFRQKTS